MREERREEKDEFATDRVAQEGRGENQTSRAGICQATTYWGKGLRQSAGCTRVSAKTVGKKNQTLATDPMERPAYQKKKEERGFSRLIFSRPRRRLR